MPNLQRLILQQPRHGRSFRVDGIDKLTSLEMLKLHSPAEEQHVPANLLASLTRVTHLELCIVPNSHDRGVHIRSILLALDPTRHTNL